MDSVNYNFSEKQELAANNCTSGDILTELSREEDTVVRKLVASNPNTPVKVLEDLGKEFPDIITNNPIFDLLVLENPNSEFIRLSLARSSTTSLKRLLKLIEDDNLDIQLAAIANSNLTSDILEKIARSYIRVREVGDR